MASKKSATKNGTTGNNNTNNNNNIHNNNNKSGVSSSCDNNQSQKQIKIKRPKTRDSDCCSINFIKYVLIIIDIIFFVSISFIFIKKKENIPEIKSIHRYWLLSSIKKFHDRLHVQILPIQIHSSIHAMSIKIGLCYRLISE